ncbi:MAG: helix-turn-helix domain-containing protein, partial [Candidatus Poribacteria bacterium]
KLTLRDVARELDISPSRVRQLVTDKGLPAEREWTEGGPRLFVGREELRAWKAQRWDLNTRRWYGKECSSGG